MRCDLNPRWYLAQLKPNGLARATLNLERQAVETFMPRHTPQNEGARPKTAPLFPGYLFVSFDPEAVSFRTVNSTFGVGRLVTFGDDYINGLPPRLIKALKARCDENGYLKPLVDLQANERVRITSGPFANFVAVVETYQSRDRVRVLFELMGQRTAAEISVRNLARLKAG